MLIFVVDEFTSSVICRCVRVSGLPASLPTPLGRAIDLRMMHRPYCRVQQNIAAD